MKNNSLSGNWLYRQQFKLTKTGTSTKKFLFSVLYNKKIAEGIHYILYVVLQRCHNTYNTVLYHNPIFLSYAFIKPFNFWLPGKTYN